MTRKPSRSRRPLLPDRHKEDPFFTEPGASLYCLHCEREWWIGRLDPSLSSNSGKLFTATVLDQARKRPPDEMPRLQERRRSWSCLPAPGSLSPSFRLRLTRIDASAQRPSPAPSRQSETRLSGQRQRLRPAVAPACFPHERTGPSGCAEPRYAAKDERMATTKMTVTFTQTTRVTPQEARRRGVALPPHGVDVPADRI